MIYLKFLWKLFLFLSVIFLAPAVSLAEIHQITNNGAWNRGASLYDGTIAWYSNVDGDFEIYYWDRTAIHQITNNNSIDWNPSLYNGTIAWQSDIDGDDEIYYWDGTTIHQITNNDTYDGFPSLYNGTIAWQGYANPSSGFEIFYWDGATIRQITNNNEHDNSPSLYDGKIAWNGYADGGPGIYYWDGNSTTKISSADGGHYVTLYNGTICWHDANYISYWNGESIYHVTEGSYTTEGPYLHNGTIAWGMTDGGIEIWDGEAIHQISTGPDRYPSNYNGTVAWERSYYVNEENRSEIFYWDGNSQPVANAGENQTISVGETLTLNGSNSFDPDGSIISWEWLLEYQSDSSFDALATGEIATVTALNAGSYIVTLTVTDNYGDTATDTMLLVVTNSHPIANAGSDQSVKVGGIVMLDGTASNDPDGEIVSWNWFLKHQSDSALDTAATGEIAKVKGLNVGSYIVTLTITDNYGGSATDTLLLEITPFPWILFQPVVKGSK